MDKWKQEALQFLASISETTATTSESVGEMKNEIESSTDTGDINARTESITAANINPKQSEPILSTKNAPTSVETSSQSISQTEINLDKDIDSVLQEATKHEIIAELVVKDEIEGVKIEEMVVLSESASGAQSTSPPTEILAIDDEISFKSIESQDTATSTASTQESYDKNDSSSSSPGSIPSPNDTSIDRKATQNPESSNITSDPTLQSNASTSNNDSSVSASKESKSIKTASNSTQTSSNHSHTASNASQASNQASTGAIQELPAAASVPTPPPSNPPSSTHKPSKSRRLRKNRINYAAQDCGAKVLAANPEAVDPSAVLVGSKDRYMLNPCSAPRQFIVLELCESVGVDHIQLGNFEFFSSMIKDVQVLASNRYPTPSWAVLGNFTIANERELQSLDFGEESELHPEWFKYLQIRILSHWGNEYYCPITEIQVHGLPYVEKLQRELQQSTREAQVVQTRFGASLTEHGPSGANEDVFGEFSGPTIDTVIPMDEYLAQHALEATEHFNTIYNTSMSEIPPSSVANFPTAPVSRPSDEGRSYDVVHAGVAPPPPKVGGDEDIDEVDEEDEVNGGDAGRSAAESEKPKKAPMGASAIPTMNLIQMIVQRVKKIEIDQSLVSGYLANVSALHQNEISELGDELAELNHHYRLLLGFVSNKSRTQEILEAKVSALTENLHVLQEQMDALPRMFRIYLAISAAVAMAISITCLFTAVIIFRCLPAASNSTVGFDVLGRSSSSGLLRSNSDIKLDLLRRSGSLGALKTGENFALVTPPPASTTPTLPQSDQVVTLGTPPPSTHALSSEHFATSSDNSSIKSEDHHFGESQTIVNPQAYKPYLQLKMEHQAALEATSDGSEHFGAAPSIAVRDVLSSHIRRHSEPHTMRPASTSN